MGKPNRGFFVKNKRLPWSTYTATGFYFDAEHSTREPTINQLPSRYEAQDFFLTSEKDEVVKGVVRFQACSTRYRGVLRDHTISLRMIDNNS